MSSTSVVIAAATTTATNDIVPNENDISVVDIDKAEQIEEDKLNNQIINDESTFIHNPIIPNESVELDNETENKETIKDSNRVSIDD